MTYKAISNLNTKAIFIPSASCSGRGEKNGKPAPLAELLLKVGAGWAECKCHHVPHLGHCQIPSVQTLSLWYSVVMASVGRGSQGRVLIIASPPSRLTSLSSYKIMPIILLFPFLPQDGDMEGINRSMAKCAEMGTWEQRRVTVSLCKCPHTELIICVNNPSDVHVAKKWKYCQRVLLQSTD